MLSVFFQKEICKILKRIIRSCMIGVCQIEEAGRNLFQAEILFNTGSASLVVVGRVQGAFQVFACAMIYIHIRTSLQIQINFVVFTDEAEKSMVPFCRS